MALATLLKQENLLATPANVPRGQTRYDLLPKETHFAPKAKAMISSRKVGGSPSVRAA